MTDTKFTPGPWQAVDSHPERSCIHVLDSYGSAVADCFGAPNERHVKRDGIWTDDPVRVANSRLLAAAPELLAACNAAETMLRCLPNTSTNANGEKPNMTTSKALEIVRAAIAAAIGEQS